MESDCYFVASSHRERENSFSLIPDISWADYRPVDFLTEIGTYNPSKRFELFGHRNNTSGRRKLHFINGSIQFYNWYSRFGPMYSMDEFLNEYQPLFYQPNYYLSNHLGLHFLNHDCRYLTVREIGKYLSKPLFVRPIESNKLFTGHVLDRCEYDYYFSKNVSPHTLVMAAPVKSISYERRNIVIDATLVTHSPYSYSEQTAIIPDDINQQMDEFLAYFIPQFSEIFPENMYVLDTCIEDNKVKIVEINALATSGLYDCDRSKIVEAVKKYANNIKV